MSDWQPDTAWESGTTGKPRSLLCTSLSLTRFFQQVLTTIGLRVLRTTMAVTVSEMATSQNTIVATQVAASTVVKKDTTSPNVLNPAKTLASATTVARLGTRLLR